MTSKHFANDIITWLKARYTIKIGQAASRRLSAWFLFEWISFFFIFYVYGVMTDLFRCPLHTRSSLGCCPLFWCPLLFLPFCNISPLSVLRPSGFTLLSSGFSSYSVSLFSPSRSFLCPHSASLSAAPSRLPTSVFLKNRCTCCLQRSS